jgi:DNA sulfur modification protein DndD
MIHFLELELTNFAIYPKATFAFSTDPEKPLTLIRGENESGKTTLMRAFLWVLFGPEGIQESSTSAYSIRPVWAKAGESIQTKVKLSFRQTRADRAVCFNLVRRLTTTDAGASQPDAERVTLSRQDADGSFRPLSEASIETLHSIIRPEMRDFYFIDADKAVDFVGGSEGNHNDQLMRKMIGKSIRALLALDALLQAAQRVATLHDGYMREIASANRGAAGASHQQELKRIEDDVQEAERALPDARAALEHAAEAYNAADSQFAAMLAQFEKASKRFQDLKQLRDERDQLNTQRRQLIHQLAECTPGVSLSAALIGKSLKEVLARLEPMKEQGHIPPHELEVIPRLLERGTCLCGASVAAGSKEAGVLETTLQRARKSEAGARFLDGVLSLAGKHKRGGADAIRNDPTTTLRKELADLDPRVAELTRAIEEIENEAHSTSGRKAEASEIKRDVTEKLARRDAARDAVSRLEERLQRSQSELRGVQEQIRIAAGRSEQVRVLQASARAAEVVRTVLQSAYEHIEQDQVQDVSRRMTELFSDMIGRTEEGLVSEVGLRPIGRNASLPEYELFALYEGREKPLRLINGASRRALSVAFVLALAEQTGSRVPLVTDSLLHSTSGEVRRRLLDSLISGKRVGQPIMFGTRADFHATEIRALLERYAGSTYTLTAQSQVGADVVRPDPDRQQARQVSVCRCGPTQFCSICERRGDSETSDLTPSAGRQER